MPLRRAGCNTNFKSHIQCKNNTFNDIRAPLKSKMNIMNPNVQSLNNNLPKNISYPLLISRNNINKKEYNENALKDEPDDFIHMNENEIILHNEIEMEEIHYSSLNRIKINEHILHNINIFENNMNNNNSNDINYLLSNYLDEKGRKEYKEYNDYFIYPNEKYLMN